MKMALAKKHILIPMPIREGTKMMLNYDRNDKNDRAGAAVRHMERMDRLYADAIRETVNVSVIYGAVKAVTEKDGETIRAAYTEEVLDSDSVSAAFLQKADARIAILNFASYLHPGGGFLRGSKAQEEALCHESALYNVLREFTDYYGYNECHKNRGLYTERAVFSPGVMFEHDKAARKIDVLTCAAPNFSAASRNYGVSEEENSKTLRKRIRFILDILNEQTVDAAVLGAFGCGVFGQNPHEVARCFREEAAKTNWQNPIRLVYAIPRSRRDNNLQAFHSVFRK